MGSCLSCLGLQSQESDVENPETSRLLYDEPYRSHYGSNIQNPQRPVYQPDPESLRREREALEGICHSMSDDVVDIFTALSPSSNETNQSKRTVSPQARSNKAKEANMSAEEMAYKTIKRGNVGRIATPLKKDEHGWLATKAAMG